MSIPELNKVTKLQDEGPNSNSIRQEKPDNVIDMDFVKKETVTPGPVNATKSKEIVVIDIENSKDVIPNIAVWTQFGPSDRPLQTPEYPHGLEGFVHPQPKTAQGGYPSAPGWGGAPTRKPQGHAYPGGGSPMGYPGGGQGRGVSKGRGGQRAAPPPQEEEQEDSDNEEQEEEEESWEYTPDKKNHWVFKILATVFIMFTVAAIGVIIIESTMGDVFDAEGTGIIAAAVSLVVLLLAQIMQMREILSVEPPTSYIILIISIPCVAVFAAALTVAIDTISIFLALFSMAVTSAVLAILARTKFNFNSWWMYAIVPFICTAVLLSSLIAYDYLLDMELETYEMVVLLVMFIQNLIFVFLLQRVLSGAYSTAGDNIWGYTASILFSSVVIIALLLLLIFLIVGARRRRRRRRVFY